MADTNSWLARVKAGGDSFLNALRELKESNGQIEQALSGAGINPVDRPNANDTLWAARSVSTNASNVISLTFSPVFVSAPPDGVVLRFVADQDIAGVGPNPPTVEIDGNTAIALKDARGNALTDGIIKAGDVVTIMTASGEARMANYIVPATSSGGGWVDGDATWDAGNSRYNVATGQSMSDSSIAVGDYFRIGIDADNPAGGTLVKIDTATPAAVKYEYKGNKYDLLSGELAQSTNVLVRWDGTDYIVVQGLSVPEIFIEATLNPCTTM